MREKLILIYRKMMYDFGEFDVWDEDIEPKLKNMSTEEIEKQYFEDRAYYTDREIAGGYWR